MAQRLPYIDNLKGVLILLVVLGHCIQATDLDFENNTIFRYIYSFHMPLFMWVSGFVSYKVQISWKSITKRFYQLMLPFISWAIVNSCIKQDIIHLYKVLLHPDTGLWFLWALFFITLLLKLCEVLSEKIKVQLEYTVISLALCMVGIMVFLKFKLLGFQFIAWYFIFYCMGFFGKKYIDYFSQIGHYILGPALILFWIMASFWMVKLPPTFMPADSHIIFNYIYRFITAIAAIIAFIPLFRYYMNYNILIISKLGGATLGIYAIHQTVIKILSCISHDISALIPYFVHLGVLWIVVIGITYLIYLIINKNRYTALLLLGK